VEQPNGDYAVTMVRSFLFDVHDYLLTGALRESRHADLAGIAAKAHKEASYHLRHSSEWLVRFGDGTAESHRRAQQALDELWRWTGGMFLADEVDQALQARGIAPDLAALQPEWRRMVDEVVGRATLAIPPVEPITSRGYRRGDHTEHLGHLLAEMQILPRSHPGAEW
jgi:ring-1,2-phenylacetyl-CoA epoxidase subunit PaaC